MATKHTTYFNLLDALKEGCPICFLVKKTTHKFMDDFLYESVNDPDLRKEIKASQGFCNCHAWQLQKFGDGFGQAIVYSDLLNIVLKQLEEIDEPYSIKELLKKNNPGIDPKQICIFCKQEKDAQERYISVFLENFDDPEFSFDYKNSFGLCLPHLALALKECRNKKIAKELIDIETGKISGLIVELKEFMRKHDYRFSKEKFGKEGDSWIRTIEKFIGKEGINQKGEQGWQK
jgi:hypothetical protein